MDFRPKPGRGASRFFIVMIAIFVLSVMAAIFATSMKVETKLAITPSTSSKCSGWAVRAWNWRVMSWLAANDHSRRAVRRAQPNLGRRAGAASASPTARWPDISLNDYPIGDGTVSVKIIDLERYANINAAPPQIIQRALNLMGVNADGISVISDSILDWISPGENPRLAGAKSDYYQSLNPPYYCKDAPMDSLSELLLVRGIRDHPEIYWGGSATNYHPAAFQQRLGLANSPFEAPAYPFGLKDIFIPISDGQVNINTANAKCAAGGSRAWTRRPRKTSLNTAPVPTAWKAPTTTPLSPTRANSVALESRRPTASF